MEKILVVGAGFAGCVIAEQLAKAGHYIDIIDKRGHIGGNCYTFTDATTNILVHKYGPHIFHTADSNVWNYVNQFAKFNPYRHSVRANVEGQIYSLPINLHTINQFFQKDWSPNEARSQIAKRATKTSHEPENFEEQALSLVGEELYRAFFKGYTEKQWGRDAKDIPAFVLKRLPVRFDYNDSYFSHPYCGMPEGGYTPIFKKIIDHPNIKLHLQTSFETSFLGDYKHCFYSGPIDEFFSYSLGYLPYRTLSFERQNLTGDYQGIAVINYCDRDVEWTRITEHKHFGSNQMSDETIIFKEFSREATVHDTPFYPVHSKEGVLLHKEYVKLSSVAKNIEFIGRLGGFRYLDMDVTIQNSLQVSKKFRDLLS